MTARAVPMERAAGPGKPDDLGEQGGIAVGDGRLWAKPMEEACGLASP